MAKNGWLKRKLGFAPMTPEEMKKKELLYKQRRDLEQMKGDLESMRSKRLKKQKSTGKGIAGFIGNVSKNMESASRSGYSPFGPSAYGAGYSSQTRPKRKKAKRRKKVYYEYR